MRQIKKASHAKHVRIIPKLIRYYDEKMIQWFVIKYYYKDKRLGLILLCKKSIRIKPTKFELSAVLRQLEENSVCTGSLCSSSETESVL